MNAYSFIIIMLIIAGIAIIGLAIFAKIRPDIVWKDRMDGTILPPERQKLGFIVILLTGIIMLMSAVVISIPQWRSHIGEIIITIVMVMISVVLFMMWKYIFSQNKRWSRIALLAVLLLSVGLLVFAGYCWYTTPAFSVKTEKILFFVIPLLVFSGFVWLAIRVKRHPERDKFMQRVMKEQKGADYEKGMQKCVIFMYLSAGVSLAWFKWLDDRVMLILAVALCLAGLIVKWHYTGEFHKWWIIALTALLTLGIGYHIWASQSSKVEVLSDMLSIEGDHGMTVYYESIDSVKVVTELPETKYCKAGYQFGGSKKGEFRLKDGSEATFYLLGKEAPYLMLYTRNGLILVNRKTAEETKLLIEELNGKIEKL